MKEKKEEEFNESFKLHKIELGPHPILCKLNTMHREIQRPIQLHLSQRLYAICTGKERKHLWNFSGQRKNSMKAPRENCPHIEFSNGLINPQTDYVCSEHCNFIFYSEKYFFEAIRLFLMFCTFNLLSNMLSHNLFCFQNTLTVTNFEIMAQNEKKYCYALKK